MVGIDVDGFGPHAPRATAITNALGNNADLEKVQEWVGHANISTTRMYDRRKSQVARRGQSDVQGDLLIAASVIFMLALKQEARDDVHNAVVTLLNIGF